MEKEVPSCSALARPPAHNDSFSSLIPLTALSHGNHGSASLILHSSSFGPQRTSPWANKSSNPFCKEWALCRARRRWRCVSCTSRGFGQMATWNRARRALALGVGCIGMQDAARHAVVGSSEVPCRKAGAVPFRHRGVRLCSPSGLLRKLAEIP